MKKYSELVIPLEELKRTLHILESEVVKIHNVTSDDIFKFKIKENDFKENAQTDTPID